MEAQKRNKAAVGDLLASMPGSDRVVIMNAARNIIFRGYAANALDHVDKARKVDRFCQRLEVFRSEEVLWDWTRIKELPPSVELTETQQYRTDQLTHFAYLEIQLANIFES